MKIRNGFVSNSSSSSFIIPKKYLNEVQVGQIYNSEIVAKEFNSERIKKFLLEDAKRWKIEETDEYLKGATTMDNFDMEDFLSCINVDMSKVHWEEGMWGTQIEDEDYTMPRQYQITEVPEGVTSGLQSGEINFNLPDYPNFISLKPNGNIYIRGNLIENDKELVGAFREFMKPDRG